MAFSPIAFIIPQYDKAKFKNWWLKAYEPGILTPKPMATDATGAIQAAKYELNSEGFPVTEGNANVIPFVDGAYDMWLFPTAAEADANDTTNAEQFADNITGVNSEDIASITSSVVISFDSLDEAVNESNALLIFDGAALDIKERSAGNGGGASWDVVPLSSVTTNTWDIVQCVGVADLALVLRADPLETTIKAYGADNATEDTEFLLASLARQGTAILEGLHKISDAPLTSNQSVIGTKSDTISVLGTGEGFTIEGVSDEDRMVDILLSGFKFRRDSERGRFLSSNLTKNLQLLNLDSAGYIPGAFDSSISIFAADSPVLDNLKFRDKASINWGSDQGLIVDGIRGTNAKVSKLDIKRAVQGMSVRYQNDFTCSDSSSHDNTTEFACGFLTEAECQNVTYNNCFASGNVRAGFYIEGNVALGVKGVNYNNCYGYNNGETGLSLNANFENVNVDGGAYYGNTGTFNSTGYGIVAANSFDVNINGPQIYDNFGDGIRYTNAFKFNVAGSSIHDNGGYGVNTPGSGLQVTIGSNSIIGNTLGEVGSLPTDSNSNYDNGAWVDYIPTFYNQDNATVVTPLTLFAKYRKMGTTIFLEIYATFTVGDLNANTYLSLPFVGNWVSGSGADAKAMRGAAYLDASAFAKVTGLSANNRLNVNPTTNTTSQIGITATYERA